MVGKLVENINKRNSPPPAHLCSLVSLRGLFFGGGTGSICESDLHVKTGRGRGRMVGEGGGEREGTGRGEIPEGWSHGYLI